MERGAKPAKAKVEARPRVARKSRTPDSTTGPQLGQRLAEALEQQAAMSEILRVISSSPTDLRSVFDTIVRRASQLCDGHRTSLVRLEGDMMHLAAQFNVKPGTVASATFPRPPARDTASGRAILDAALVQIPDVKKDREIWPGLARTLDLGSMLSVPLLRDGKPIGAITVSRASPGLFPENRIGLLKTFADQAVIAIENVRLFKELEERNRDLTEALEQQTATSDILRVISSSPTDVQPVFDAIVRSAAHLFGRKAALRTVEDEGLRRRARSYIAGDEFHPPDVVPVNTDSLVGRAVLECRALQLADAHAQTAIPYARRLAFRSVATAPLVRDGVAIGVISVSSPDPGAMSDKQMALLATFADQAVIAIENVRLFNETKEALERQTATSEILRVISQSPMDVQPVFDTIVTAALALCGAISANVVTFDGELIHLAAFAPATPEAAASLRRTYPRPPSRDTANARAVLTRSLVVIPDVLEDRDYAIGARAAASGYRSVVSVPLMREESPIGALTVARDQPGRFPEKQIALLRTFADQAVIAIENVRLFDEVQAHARDLSVSLQQQTATADVLKVISRSAFDLQTVLDTLTESACKLCEAKTSVVLRPDGNGFKAAATFGMSPMHKAAVEQLVVRPGRDTCSGRALLERKTVHIPDAAVDPDYNVPGVLGVTGNRAMLGVPMLRDGAPMGVLVLTRSVALPFTDKQIALATTFADQAAIAIENVRLFNETKEALEQQTATSEILRVMSQSPTDVQPVFDTIATAALKLCNASSAVVTRFDGELLRVVALANVSAEGADAVRRRYPRRPGRFNAAGRAVLTRSAVVIPDVLDEPEFEISPPLVAAGFRSVAAIPLLREGVPLGAITIAHPEPGAFPDKQIALLKIFAAQAVIAIENVRLFNETKEALERQTATSEILRVISQSPRDVQPVFDTIVKSAVRLCEARFGAVFRLDGGLVHLAAHHNFSGTLLARFQKGYPMAPNRGHLSGRAILTGTAVQVPDILADEEYLGGTVKAAGFRSLLGVPLLRGGRAIGAIVIYRAELGPFADKHIELLRTFADQAVIAIENVRLFKELEARTAQLTRSVGELKALGEVGQAVSSTLDLETVLSTIVSRAVQLAGMDGGSIWEYDEAREQFYVRATDRLPDELVEVHRATPIRKGEGALGRVAMTREPVDIRDIADESSYPSRLREILIRCGYRSVLAVPLLREDHLLGALAVSRTTPGEFDPGAITLLKTFATQSALAIQNARLYREIEVKSKELEAASRHKSEFLANMSHELRTPLNAIIGFSEVLSERMFGQINEKQAEYIGDILQSGQHLLSLINDILDLSKVEAGRMELELSDFDLPNIIDNTLILVRERALRRSIALGREIDERLGVIRADERKVKQVLLNLLSNALKFTPEGGQISVRAAVRDGVAEISVTDTGVGIAPDDQEMVFEEFRQVRTASKSVEGTGLGLAISRKFIELHGGRIWVNSQLGAGSTFTFTLPLKIESRHQIT